MPRAVVKLREADLGDDGVTRHPRQARRVGKLKNKVLGAVLFPPREGGKVLLNRGADGVLHVQLDPGRVHAGLTPAADVNVRDNDARLSRIGRRVRAVHHDLPDGLVDCGLLVRLQGAWVCVYLEVPALHAARGHRLLGGAMRAILLDLKNLLLDLVPRGTLVLQSLAQKPLLLAELILLNQISEKLIH